VESCPVEIEEKNGLIYRKCEHVGLKPLPLNINNRVWELFILIVNTELFSKYPFLLEDYFRLTGMKLSQIELFKLIYLFNMKKQEDFTRGKNFCPALMRVL
jgi:hypothetical protein